MASFKLRLLLGATMAFAAVLDSATAATAPATLKIGTLYASSGPFAGIYSPPIMRAA